MVDWLPLFSQTKSGFQYLMGDAEGALRTQKNFLKRCPVVSQIRSLVEYRSGSPAAAYGTQMEFIRTANEVLNAIPILGHAKGLVHYFLGDRESGDDAMKDASRTYGSVEAGALGFCFGGPIGAMLAGIGGAALMDIVTTTIDSLVHNQYRSSGYVNKIAALFKNPQNPGKWFDFFCSLAFDGWSGHSGKQNGKKSNSTIAGMDPVAIGKKAFCWKTKANRIKDLSSHFISDADINDDDD